MTEPTIRFTDAIVSAAPPWLRRSVGGRVLRGIGEVVERVFHATSDGIATRFPGAVIGADDSLPYTGRDRRLARGPAEDATTYARRLRTWWDAHRRRGGSYALLEQLHLFLVNTEPRRWDLVARNGVRHILDGATGAITRDVIPVDKSDRWARMRVFVLFDGFPSISEQQRDAYTYIPREWDAAHVEETKVVAIWPPDGGGVWDYPPGELWDEPAGELWDEGALVVDELFAEGPPEDAMWVNGGPMVINSGYMVVDS